jgi:hypothetical protein
VNQVAEMTVALVRLSRSDTDFGIDVCRRRSVGTRIPMALKLLILRDVAQQQGRIRWVAVRSRRSAKVEQIEAEANKTGANRAAHPHR